MSAKLADFLNHHPRLKGLSVAEKGRLAGIQRPTMSRILKGTVTPTVENALRIAAALEVHPGTLHELAGQAQLAKLYWRLFPMGAGSHPLQRRLSQLLQLGLENVLSDALDLVEGVSVRRLSVLVEEIAVEAGADAALVLADTPSNEGMVISAWRCAVEEQALLCRRGMAKGWQSYHYSAGSLALKLFLKRSGSPLRRADALLSVIAAFLSPKLPG